jgi:hypothetical protein
MLSYLGTTKWTIGINVILRPWLLDLRYKSCPFAFLKSSQLKHQSETFVLSNRTFFIRIWCRSPQVQVCSLRLCQLDLFSAMCQHSHFYNTIILGRWNWLGPDNIIFARAWRRWWPFWIVSVCKTHSFLRKSAYFVCILKILVGTWNVVHQIICLSLAFSESNWRWRLQLLLILIASWPEHSLIK